jgi:hypothetical protein
MDARTVIETPSDPLHRKRVTTQIYRKSTFYGCGTLFYVGRLCHICAECACSPDRWTSAVRATFAPEVSQHLGMGHSCGCGIEYQSLPTISPHGWFGILGYCPVEAVVWELEGSIYGQKAMEVKHLFFESFSDQSFDLHQSNLASIDSSSTC